MERRLASGGVKLSEGVTGMSTDPSREKYGAETVCITTSALSPDDDDVKIESGRGDLEESGEGDRARDERRGILERPKVGERALSDGVKVMNGGRDVAVAASVR